MPVSDELSGLLQNVEEYITENRLNNVIIHIGEVSLPKDFGKIMGLYAKDLVRLVALISTMLSRYFISPR